MTETLLREFAPEIASWELIPSNGGVCEVTINDELVFSKGALGRHAEIDEIREALMHTLL